MLGMIETEPGNISPESGEVFIWPEFGDMAAGIMACPCLPTVTLSGHCRSRPATTVCTALIAFRDSLNRHCP